MTICDDYFSRHQVAMGMGELKPHQFAGNCFGRTLCTKKKTEWWLKFDKINFLGIDRRKKHINFPVNLEALNFSILWDSMFSDQPRLACWVVHAMHQLAPYSNNTSSFFKNSSWTLSLLVCLVMVKLLFCHPYVWTSGQNPTCMHPKNNRLNDF